MAHPIGDLYGSDRVTLATVEALVRAGRRVTVALGEAGPLVELLRKAGADVVIVPTPILRRAALRPTGLLHLAIDACRGLVAALRLLRRIRPDVIYVSTITIPLWLLLGRLTGRLTVCHVHEAERDVSPLVGRVLHGPLRLAHAVLANSDFTARVAAAGRAAVRDRTEVVANAVPGPGVVTPARVSIDDGLRIVFVGRLSPRKGPDVAVEALRMLRASGCEARLEIVGSVFPGYEWYDAELRKAIGAGGLEDHVTMTGFCEDVWPRYAEADVAVVPSIRPEPFGNVAIEALLAARPVVVADSGGLPGATAGLGSPIVVPPGDARALASALQQIADEWHVRRSAAEIDAAVCAQRHDPERYASRIVTLFEEWEHRHSG